MLFFIGLTLTLSTFGFPDGISTTKKDTQHGYDTGHYQIYVFLIMGLVQLRSWCKK